MGAASVALFQPKVLLRNGAAQTKRLTSFEDGASEPTATGYPKLRADRFHPRRVALAGEAQFVTELPGNHS